MLADLDDGERDAVICTVDDGPRLAPGLLAWIEHLCDGEQSRRADLGSPL